MSSPTHCSQAQLKRLAFIDFCLAYFGQLSRGNLLQQFQTGVASATRYLTLYRELTPHNMVLRHQTKLHYRTPDFKPLFEHQADTVLQKLSAGKADQLKLPIEPGALCLDAVRLIAAPNQTVATLMRAITQSSAIRCVYVSLSSGETERELVPHAMMNSGHRWHVRGYDRNSQSFRDFVCNRFISLTMTDAPVADAESHAADTSRHHLLSVTLIPHPKLTRPKAIELDYGMEDGRLTLTLRKAVLGYVARQWQIDCSEDHHLAPLQFPLAWADPQQLKALNDISLLPGVLK